MLELFNRAAIGEDGKLGGCKDESGTQWRSAPGGIMTAVRYCGGATFVTPLAAHREGVSSAGMGARGLP